MILIIYGKLIEEPNFRQIAIQIEEDKKFKVFGFKPIRKELRNTPKNNKLGKLNKRNIMFNAL